jgi:hypothetical protein
MVADMAPRTRRIGKLEVSTAGLGCGNLASRLLTGKYRRGAALPDQVRLTRDLRGNEVRTYFPALLGDACFDVVEALERYAADRGRTLLELALGWLAAKSYVAGVIAGATRPEQVHANVAAVHAWALTGEEQRDVEQLTRVDVAYTWHPGVPEYSQPPAGTDSGAAPEVRTQAFRR